MTPGFDPGDLGSNPSKEANLKSKQTPRSLLVRTLGFHPGEEGSIPFEETNFKVLSRVKRQASPH